MTINNIDKGKIDSIKFENIHQSLYRSVNYIKSKYV